MRTFSRPTLSKPPTNTLRAQSKTISFKRADNSGIIAAVLSCRDFIVSELLVSNPYHKCYTFDDLCLVLSPKTKHLRQRAIYSRHAFLQGNVISETQNSIAYLDLLGFCFNVSCITYSTQSGSGLCVCNCNKIHLVNRSIRRFLTLFISLKCVALFACMFN